MRFGRLLVLNFVPGIRKSLPNALENSSHFSRIISTRSDVTDQISAISLVNTRTLHVFHGKTTKESYLVLFQSYKVVQELRNKLASTYRLCALI